MKETFRARELDQRVLFQRDVLTDDGMGGKAKTMAPIAEVWAKVRPMSGGEREQADRLNSEGRYLIVIRYRDDIDETAVAVWKGRPFNIRFAKDQPRSRFLALEAERGVTV